MNSIRHSDFDCSLIGLHELSNLKVRMTKTNYELRTKAERVGFEPTYRQRR